MAGARNQARGTGRLLISEERPDPSRMEFERNRRVRSYNGLTAAAYMASNL